MIGLLAPYLYARGFDFVALMLFLLSVPIHYFSFGHNSLMDYWYDIHDRFKKHHPLITGEISLSSAHKVIHSGAVLTCLALIVLTVLFSPLPTAALACLMLYIVFGHAYNDGLDKHTIHSWVPISLCFTFLPLYGWFMGHSELGIKPAIIGLASFSIIFWQIAVSGNLKDIEADRVNLLRTLGLRIVFGEVRVSKKSMYFMYSALVFKVIALITLIQLFTDLPTAIIPSVLLGLAVGASINELKIEGKVWDRIRGKTILAMSFVEIFSIYAMLYALVEPLTATAIAIVGVAYFFTVNKLIWKVPYPKV